MSSGDDNEGLSSTHPPTNIGSDLKVKGPAKLRY